MFPLDPPGNIRKPKGTLGRNRVKQKNFRRLVFNLIYLNLMVV